MRKDRRKEGSRRGEARWKGAETKRRRKREEGTSVIKEGRKQEKKTGRKREEYKRIDAGRKEGKRRGETEEGRKVCVLRSMKTS